MTEPHIGLRLDPQDRALLAACARKKKLTKSDIMRLALRDYAAALGVTAEPPKMAKQSRLRGKVKR